MKLGKIAAKNEKWSKKFFPQLTQQDFWTLMKSLIGSNVAVPNINEPREVEKLTAA